MKRILLLLAGLLCLASCNTDTPYYQISEMISVNDGKITNDAGIKYHITNISTLPDLLKIERAYVKGRASREGTDPSYDYDLMVEACYAVSVKEAVRSSASSEDYGTSPVSMQAGWFSGGYFNVLVAVSYLKSEGYKGEINLVLDEEKSTATDLYFSLKNKQDGRTWEDETMGESEVEFGQEYFSFKYLDIIPKEAKGYVTIHMNWLWFDANNINPDAKVPLHSVSEKSDTCEIQLQ